MTYIEVCDEVVEILERFGDAHVARVLQIKPSSVWEWRRGRSAVPTMRLDALLKLGGKELVTRDIETKE